MSEEKPQLWRGREVLPQATKDRPCHYVDDGKGVKGYVPYTDDEIAAHDAWLASLPAKQERRSAAAAARHRAELIKLKDELESIPAEETRAALPPAGRN